MSNPNQIALEILLTESGVEPTKAKLLAAIASIQRALGATANTGNQSADDLIRASNRVTEAIEDQSQATREIGQVSGDTDKILNTITDALNHTLEALDPLSEEFSQVATGLTEIAATAGGIAGITAGLTALGAASVVVIGKLFEISSATADVAKQSEEFQRFVGIGRELAAGLELGAKAVGASIGDLKDGLAQFKGVLNEAFQGAEDKQEALAALGATDFSSLETALGQIATKLQTSGDAARGLSLELNKAFGEEGSRQLEPILKGLAESKRRAEEFGLIIKEDVVRQSLEFKSVFADIEAQIQGATNIVGSRFLKAFTEVGKVISDVVSQLRNNAAFTSGLENLANLAEKLITGSLPTLVKLLSDIVAFGGKFGGFLAAAAVGTNELESAIAKLPSTVDATVEKIRSLDKTTISYSDAIKKVIAELEKLQKIGEVNNQGLEANIQQQIAAIDAAEKAGTRSALDASQEKNRILLRQSERLKEQAQSDLEFLRNRLKNEVEEQNKAREVTLKQEQIAVDKRQQQQALYDEYIKGLEVKRAEFLRDRNNQNSRLTQEQLEKNQALAQKDFETKIKNDEFLIKLRGGLLRLDNEIATAQAKRASVENNIFQLQQKFGEKDLELKAKLSEAEAKELQTKEENATRTEQAILTTKQNAITAANKLESQAIAEQKQLLQSKIRTAQEVETQITKINIVAQQDRVNAGIKALEDFNNKNIQNLELRKQLEIDLANEQIRLSDLKSKQTVDNLNREIFLIKTNIELTQDVNLKALEKIELEQKALELLKAQGATKEQLLVQESKIIVAIGEANKAREDARLKEKQLLDEKIQAAQKAIALQNQEIAGIERLADRSSSAVAALKGGLTTIGESLDLNSLSVEQLDQRLEELQGRADFIRNAVAIPDKDVFLREIEDTLEAINQRKVQLTQGAALEAARKEQEIALQQARETAQKLVEIAEEREQDILETKQNRREEEKKLNSDREEEAKSFSEKLKDLETDLASDLAEIAENKAKTEKEIADRAIAEEEERQRRIVEIKKKAAQEAASSANAIELNSLAERLKLQQDIDAEKDPKKKAEAEKKLAEEKRKIDQANKKAEEIAALEKQNLTEEEFQLRKKAIEDRFDLEEKAAQERIQLAELTDERLKKEGLARLDQLIKEEQARKDKAFADELASIKAAQARKAKQEEEERKRKLDAFDQQAKDRQIAFDKAQAQEKADHEKRLAELDKRQQEIRAKYKETIEDINKRSLEAAKQIGATGEAIANAFALGNKELEKYLANLKKVADAQSNINPTNTNQNGSASSNNSNAGSLLGGSTTGSINSSPVTSPTNNNSNAGSTGNTSNSKGIVQQPAKDKSGNQKPGIPTPSKFGGEKTGDIPSVSASDAKSYRESAFKLLSKWEGSDKGDQLRNKLNSKLFEITSNYIKSAKLDSFIADQILRNPPGVNYFAKADKNREQFTLAIDAIIKTVENSRKKEEGQTKSGSATENTGGAISSVDTPGGLSGSGVGGSGGKGNPNPTETQNPNVISPAPPDPKDTRFDPKKENVGEGAEAAGFVITFPSDPSKNKTKTSTTQITPNPSGSNPSPSINNSPNIAPTFAPKFEIVLQPRGQVTENDLRKSIQELNSAVKDVSNQQAQEFVNTLTSIVFEKFNQSFR